MKRYGQFCPIAKAAEVFCARWTPLILRDLAAGATRFSELHKGIPLASPSVLSARLKELEAEGIVERRRSESGRSWTYHLTPAGQEFAPLILALGEWGQRWSRRDLEEDEVDLDLLLWALEKNCDPAAFGGGRALVEIRLADQPEHKATWWFLNEAGRCELCVHPPGFEVDLYVTTDLRTLIRIWRGDRTLGSALAAERITLHGSRAAEAAFSGWMLPGPLAHIPPAETVA